ncbi:unnamed protein product [Cunninghamella echinulata]
MKLSLFISSALIALASAQTPIISVTSPLQGTKLKAGTDAVISWVNPSSPTISQIVLAQGPSTALQPVTTLAQNVNAADGKYIWKIPIEIANGQYALEFGNSPNMAYAGPFTIEGGVGGTISPPTTANNTTPTPPPATTQPVTPPPATAQPSNPPSTPSNNKPATSPSTSGTTTSPSSGASQLISSNNMALLAGGAIIVASQFL